MSLAVGGTLQQQYWLPHQEHVWLAYNLMASDADRITLAADEGGDVIVKDAKDLANLAAVQEDQVNGVEDVCSLGVVSEASLLSTVRTRYAREAIYTWVDATLVALNPFKNLPIYDSQHVQQYRMCTDTSTLPPHIFSIAKNAIKAIRTTEKDQAVLISGESGAGKTESTKLLLSFIVDACRGSQSSESSDIESRVLQTNRVLEAFGNATTVRNANSSRFGKWLDLRCSGAQEITGCNFTSYLLETMRVCSQAGNERCFHIFFQVLQARQSALLSGMNLKESTTYRYLKGGLQVSPSIDDSRGFEELREAMKALGIDEAAEKEIFQIIGAILSLGNCDFKEVSDAVDLLSNEPVAEAAKLLGLDENKLAAVLKTKQLTLGRDVTVVPLRLAEAQAARDGLARLLYGRLFQHLINHMNTVLATSAPKEEDRLLGLLDIAGFECMDHNALEQLMINLSNEHLQQHFIEMIFKKELQEAAKEGVKCADVGFVDNADCLALIDGTGGVLDLLDETCNVPKPTDMLFVTKVLKVQEGHARLIAPKVSRCGFGIKHFAGNVTYQCEGWLERNNDKPRPDISELLQASSVEVVKKIGNAVEEEAKAAAAAGAPGKGKKSKSVTAGFRVSLKALMAKIREANPHYIRCIKPNQQHVPGVFASRMVMDQLLVSGVLGQIQIRQTGYASRVPHKTFLGLYGGLAHLLSKDRKSSVSVTKGEGREDAAHTITVLREVLPELGALGEDVFALGSTKVFMRLTAFRALEAARHNIIGRAVLRAQAGVRGFIMRRRVHKKKVVCKEIREFLDEHKLKGEAAPAGGATMSKTKSRRATVTWQGDSILQSVGGSMEKLGDVESKVTQLLEKADGVFLLNADTRALQRVLARIHSEAAVMKEVEACKSSLDAVEIEKALVKARAQQLPLMMTPIMEAQERLVRVREQLPLVKAMEAAMKEEDHEEQIKQAMEIAAVADDIDLSEDSEKWLPDFAHAKQMLKDLLDLIPPEPEEPKAEVAESTPASDGPSASDSEEGVKPADVNVTITASGDEAPGQSSSSEAASGEASDDTSPDSRLAPTHSALHKTQDDNNSEPKKPRRIATVVDIEPLSPTSTRAPSEAERGIGALLAAGPRQASNRKTIASFATVVKEDELTRNFQRAMREYDAEALEALMRQAAEKGMDVDADIHEVFECLNTDSFLLLALEEAASDVECFEADVPITVLRRLDNLTHQLSKMPGFAEDVADGRQILQGKLSRRCLTTAEKPSVAELDLSEKVFRDLSELWSLKRSTRQKTEARAASATNGLGHCSHGIEESFTTCPEHYNASAFQEKAKLNFLNILVSMGDRPAQACQQSASSDAVLELAKLEPPLRDEIFLQVLSQLMGNPSQRSLALGWELLHRLCLITLPSPELTSFMRAMLQRAEAHMSTIADGDSLSAAPWARAMVRACSAALLLHMR